MSKLYFRYGAMNSGKSTALLQAAHNYEERGQRVLLAKPMVDTKGHRSIVSRLGVSREVDFTLAREDDVHAVFEAERARLRAETGADVACLLLDEAQFLTGVQVDDLLRIATIEERPGHRVRDPDGLPDGGVPGQPAPAGDRPLARRAEDDLPVRAQGALQRAHGRRGVRV